MYNFNRKFLFNLDIKFILMHISCMSKYLFLSLRTYKRGRESLRRSYRRPPPLSTRSTNTRPSRRNWRPGSRPWRRRNWSWAPSCPPRPKTGTRSMSRTLRPTRSRTNSIQSLYVPWKRGWSSSWRRTRITRRKLQCWRKLFKVMNSFKLNTQ